MFGKMISPYQVPSIFEDWNASTCACTFFDKSVIDASLTNINQAKQLRNLLLCSPPGLQLPAEAGAACAAQW